MGSAIIVLCLLCVKFAVLRYVAFFLILWMLPVAWLLPAFIGFFLAFIYRRFDLVKM